MPATPSDAHDGLPVPRRYWSAFAVWLAMFMAVVDGAIANVALPTIARDLQIAPAESIWVVNAYQLTILVSLLPLASLGETIGYRRVYQGGLALFTLASLGCALAHSLPVLIAARALQGLGAAGIMSVNGALVRLTYPHRMLGRGVGLNALVAAGSAALGPTIASAVLSVASWEWLFAINVPIGFVAFAVARASLPSSATVSGYDRPSALLNVLTFGLVFLSIDTITRAPTGWLGWALLAAGAACGVWLVNRSWRRPRPIVPVDLLRSPRFALTVATSIASFAAQTLAFVSLPFYFQGALHQDQVATGLLITPWPVATAVGAPLAGWLADRYPATILSSAGMFLMALGLCLLATMPADATAFEIAWRMAVCGFGFGFFQSPNNRTMLSSAPLARSGAASGMLATARLTGQTFGATLAAITFRMAGEAETVALATAAIIAAIGALVSLSRLLPHTERRPKTALPGAETP